MKETLDEQSRIELVRYRMERANETMEEFRILAENSYYNAAATACFFITPFAIG